MTYREAIIEAHARMEPRTDVTSLLRFAEVRVPGAKTSAEIPKGMEEAVIGDLLAMAKQFSALSTTELRDLQAMIASGPQLN